MDRSYSKYINKVLKRINCSSEYKTRIREDLNIILNEKSIKLRETDPYKLLGNPDDVAVEFAENMGVDLFSKYAYVSETTFLGMPLIRVDDGKHRYIEYKSKKEFMGFPLVHVNNKPYGVAKGIIAVGSISIGVISVGGISFGLISLGGISFAILLGMGGVALSLIAAIGGATVGGFFAFGGSAMSNYISIGGAAFARELAFGGYARARVALGGTIHASVGFYTQSGTGEFVRQVISDPEAMTTYIFDKAPDLDFTVRYLVARLVRFFTY